MNATTSWHYDVRERTISESRAIAGVAGYERNGSFTTLAGYDGVDRVVTTTRSSGEVVTTTYNVAGQANSLFGGAQGLVTNAAYNILNQPQVITFGNGVKTQYLYFGLDYQVGGNPYQFYGRLRQIYVTTNNCVLGYYCHTGHPHANTAVAGTHS